MLLVVMIHFQTAHDNVNNLNTKYVYVVIIDRI